MKRFRIKQNIWGNWYGYLGSRKVADCGSEFDAKMWLAEKQADANADSVCDYERPNRKELPKFQIKG